MFIIVSNDTRIPETLSGCRVEQWQVSEFYEHASFEEGLIIDEGLWYDFSVITEPIYEALSQSGLDSQLVYYMYDDAPLSDFAKSVLNDDVIVYSTAKPVEQEKPIQVNNLPDPIVAEVAEENTTIIPEPVLNSQPTTQMSQINQNVVQAPYSQPIQNQYEQNTNIYQQPVSNGPLINGMPLVGGNIQNNMISGMGMPAPQMNTNMSNMLLYDDFDAKTGNRKAAPAKVFLFGSSKGGTGKTFTCLISAYWYAKQHPKQKVALADFDIIDGQIGITINKLTPTMQDFYKLHKGGVGDYAHLENCRVRSEHFSPNIDFYLAPSQDIPTVTNDHAFWTDLFKLLITNYDVVFFDSGIDYLGKPPISQLYKIADKIIITCNPSINSVKSVIKQFKTLSGQRLNPVFRPADDILRKINVVLTRVGNQEDINNTVVTNITKYAPVIAAFGNIDHIISQVQWYQMWTLIDNNPDIIMYLDEITKLEDTTE